jgi:hypothetical protein
VVEHTRFIELSFILTLCNTRVQDWSLGTTIIELKEYEASGAVENA